MQATPQEMQGVPAILKEEEYETEAWRQLMEKERGIVGKEFYKPNQRLSPSSRTCTGRGRDRALAASRSRAPDPRT